MSEPSHVHIKRIAHKRASWERFIDYISHSGYRGRDMTLFQVILQFVRLND